jgi:acetylornithine deacetylase/succinyl-diaminopimelate desuccinylase-like protein
MPDRKSLARRIDGLLDWAARELAALTKIPSVSTGGADRSALRESALAVAALFRRAGCEARLLQCAGGVEAVYATHDGRVDPDVPTVLLYAHHDVVGASEAGWTTPPFVPRWDTGRVFGRGTSDDKGGVVTHALAIRACAGTRTPRIKVLIDGEEEIGSPSLGSLLAAHRGEFEADTILVLDGSNLADDRPALTCSMRGEIGCTLTLTTATRPAHSGVYGGLIPDAASAIVQLLSTLHRIDGSVAVDDLGGGAVPSTPVEARTLRREAGLLDSVQLLGAGEQNARVWQGPAVTITGIDAPAVDSATNVLVPSASARVSIRIGPSVDPVDAWRRIERHLFAHVPWGARLDVAVDTLLRGFADRGDSDRDGAIRDAFAEAWETPCAVVGTGATIPAVALLAAAYPDACLAIPGIDDPASNSHGPDESVSLLAIRNAALAEAFVFDRVGETG